MVQELHTSNQQKIRISSSTYSNDRWWKEVACRILKKTPHGNIRIVQKKEGVQPFLLDSD